MASEESNLIEEMNDIIEEALRKESPPPQADSKAITFHILNLAIRIEKLSGEHYSGMAKKVKDPRGKDMFKYLAKEESKHAKALKTEYEAIKQDNNWLMKEKVLPQERVCAVVDPKKKAVKASRDIMPEESHVTKSTTDLEALKLAMEVKKRAIKFYCAAGAKIQDPQGRKMFSRLVSIENRHLNELEVQYAWLDEAGFWYDHTMMTD